MYEKEKNDYGMELADTGARLGAMIIDSIILGIVAGVIFGTTRDSAWALNFMLTLGYNWYFWTRSNGQTPGKRIMGIRVVRYDGGPLNDVDALIRAIGYYVNSMVFGLGWIWALFDDRKRGWHDMLAKTLVVKA